MSQVTVKDARCDLTYATYFCRVCCAKVVGVTTSESFIAYVYFEP